jgi:CheY-like chemotaxis protein
VHVRLVHWHADEAEERATRLRDAGFTVDAAVPDGPPALRALRASPPDAVLIDLSRLPSQGRDFAVQLRLSPATRSVPIVFAGGDEERAARVRALLPDATFAAWDDAPAVLRGAAPVADPVVPAGALAAYAGAPLARKLGIGAGVAVSLVDAPAAFESLLVELPPGAAVRRRHPRPGDLVVWFVTDRGELERRIGELGAAGAGLWVVWPKRGSALAGELTQPIVRRLGLASGLVDYKVCSVDTTWTGLRFRRRGSG